jgi:SAM-dependent methyltransferase
MNIAPTAAAYDDAHTIAFFSNLLHQHRVSPLSVNWGSQASQERRFAVLAGIGELAGRSVLDVGCGLGDFYGWQQRQKLGVEYHGVDLTPAMAQAAQARFPEASFRAGNVLVEDFGTFDYVIASGIFYLRQHEPVRFLQSMIARLFAMSRRGVAFNSLSTWSTRKEAGEFYADPAETLEFCRTLTPRVVLRHDYHPGDFTVHLLKPAPSP